MLAPEILKRVDALTELQKEHDEQVAAYEEEKRQLLLKYQALRAPIFAKRAGEFAFSSVNLPVAQ